MKIDLFKPVKPWFVTQQFGVNGEWYRNNGIDILNHNGLDLLTHHKQPIHAAHDGEIVALGVDFRGGWGIQLVSTDWTYKTIYWHTIDKFPVNIGDKVRAGDLIGWADNTGFSTGEHLHWGLKQIKRTGNETWENINQDNGYLGAEDPTPYLNGMYAEDVKQIISIYKKLAEALRQLIKIWTNLKNK